MPLTNASRAMDAEYLSDGITEAIINSLAGLPNVRIVPRSTVFRYKGLDVDPSTIGRELDVRSVLTGRVEQRGDTLTIAVELVDTATQSQVWGDRYQRRLAEIFEMQEEIAHKILETLRVKLTGPDRNRMARRHTHSVEAYQLAICEDGTSGTNEHRAGSKRASDTFSRRSTAIRGTRCHTRAWQTRTTFSAVMESVERRRSFLWRRRRRPRLSRSMTHWLKRTIPWVDSFLL